MGNGILERLNQTLLGTLEDDQNSDWRYYISIFADAYNFIRHEGTGVSLSISYVRATFKIGS